MVDLVSPSIFRIEVPLPKNPLKAINCYLIKTQDRNLLVDTGMNRPECREALYSGLGELSVDLEQTDLFVTHLHADHSGLAGELSSTISTAYCSREDAQLINSTDHWRDMLAYAGRSGFPEDRLGDAHERHPGYRYRSRGQVSFAEVDDGDTVSVGERRFTCVKTPGHTPGHICLYEANTRILIAADLILDSITPNISLWSDDENPLQQYLDSLDRVYPMEIDLVLPGHRSVITDCRGKIDELRHHHEIRLAEVLSLLEPTPQSAYQVASRMTWDMSYSTWEEFPIPQKWFATGEAISHLRYLEAKGLIRREDEEGKIFYARLG